MSVDLVRKTARCLQTLPPSANQALVQSYMQACDVVLQALEAGAIVDSGSQYHYCVTAKNVILDRVDQLTEMREEALTNGYVLPDDPFVVIASIDIRNKVLFGSAENDTNVCADLVESMRGLVAAFQAQESGEIDFSVQKGGTSQLSSFDMSVDGFMESSTGDALADILGYQPDADLLKRKRAIDALAALGFDRRKPQVLFVSDDGEDGRQIAILGWRKIRDAAEYKITKRDVFAETTSEFSFTNKQLADQQITAVEQLAFFDDVQPDDVWTWVDTDVRRDALYMYSIIGVRQNAVGSRNTFSFPASPLFVSPAQITEISNAVAADAESLGVDIESINPYPAVAQIVYGDSRYDWLLAAINFLGSRSRGDSDPIVRNASFLGARLSTVTQMLSAGLFLAPDDVAAVIASVESSVSSFGVSQAILDVLDATGSSLFIASKDDPAGFQETDVAVDIATGGLAKILGSIDPETATIDPQTLLTNISTQDDSLQSYRAREISAQNDGLKFTEIIGSDIIDLTSYDGISRLMRAIRVFYDVSSLRF